MNLKLILVVLLGVTFTYLFAKPSIYLLGDLSGGQFSSHAMDISGDGKVVVGYGTNETKLEAFIWDLSGGIVGLGDYFEEGFNSRAFAISTDGSVIAGVTSDLDTINRAFVLDVQSGLTIIGDLPGGLDSGWAEGISGDGKVVVGWGSTDEGTMPFKWEAGEFTQLADPSDGIESAAAYAASEDGSVIIGGKTLHSQPWDGAAVVWQDDLSMIDIGWDFSDPNNKPITAKDISPDGTAIVGSFESGVGQNGFLKREGYPDTVLYDLPNESIPYADAYGVSADGSVVVGLGSFGNTAIIWLQALDYQPVSLDDLTDQLGIESNGIHFKYAVGVSDDGLKIVGRAIHSTGEGEAFLLILEEPVTWRGFIVRHGDGIQTVDTSDWLGILEISNRPWIYSYSLNHWMYDSGQSDSSDGLWMYLPK